MNMFKTINMSISMNTTACSLSVTSRRYASAEGYVGYGYGSSGDSGTESKSESESENKDENESKDENEIGGGGIDTATHGSSSTSSSEQRAQAAELLNVSSAEMRAAKALQRDEASTASPTQGSITNTNGSSSRRRRSSLFTKERSEFSSSACEGDVLISGIYVVFCALYLN